MDFKEYLIQELFEAESNNGGPIEKKSYKFVMGNFSDGTIEKLLKGETHVHVQTDKSKVYYEYDAKTGIMTIRYESFPKSPTTIQLTDIPKAKVDEVEYRGGYPGRRMSNGGWKEWDEPPGEDDVRTKENSRWYDSYKGGKLAAGKVPGVTVEPKAATPPLETKTVSKCKTCGKEIKWIKSEKTGKMYPVNVAKGEGDNYTYKKNDFHKD